MLPEQIEKVRGLEEAFHEILPVMTDQEARDLLDGFDSEAIQITLPPETGLLMVTAQDCFDIPFYLGELLTTKAEVSWNGERGHAMLMGSVPEKALLAAAVNAQVNGGSEQIGQTIESILASFKKRLIAAQERELQFAAATRVNFESMAEEK